jgi:hypothetical protein
MKLDNSGNLGIGTTSPTVILDVRGTLMVRETSGGDIFVRSSVDGTNLPAIQVSTASPLAFFTSNLERMRIDASGNVLVGTTSVSGAGVWLAPSASTPLVSVTGSASSGGSTYTLYSTGASAYRFYVDFGGTIFATSTTISAISDIRYKENVRDLDVGLDAIMALKPRLYDWKEGKGADIKNARGFIAQEFETVFPDLIDEWKDPAPEGEEPYKSVRQDLIPVLVKAIQEQQAMISNLTARLEKLEGK